MHPFGGDRLDLYRAAALIRSLKRFGSLEALSALYVVVPDHALRAAEALQSLDGDGSNVRLVSEKELFSESEVEAMRGVSGWHRQQLVKLATPRLCPEAAFLTLDSDIVNLAPLRAAELFHDGRVPVQYGIQFEKWVESSRALLPGATVPERTMGVTPAFLSRAGLEVLHETLQHHWGGADISWVHVLCQASLAQTSWTEYLLYQMACQHAGVWDELHRESEGRLQVGLWKQTKVKSEELERFRTSGALFLVNQSIRPDADQTHEKVFAHELPSLLDLSPREIGLLGSSLESALRASGSLVPKHRTEVEEHVAYLGDLLEGRPLDRPLDARQQGALPIAELQPAKFVAGLVEQLQAGDVVTVGRRLIALLQFGAWSDEAVALAYLVLGKSGRSLPIYFDAVRRLEHPSPSFSSFFSAVATLMRLGSMHQVSRLLLLGRRPFRQRASFHRLRGEVLLRGGYRAAALRAAQRAVALSPANRKYIFFRDQISMGLLNRPLPAVSSTLSTS